MAMHAACSICSSNCCGAAQTQNITELTAEFLANSLGSQIRRFDKGGESFYNQISALHKSVRGSPPQCRALLVFAACSTAARTRATRRAASCAWLGEDIGPADPRALQIANEAAATFERLGSPEGDLALAQAVLLPCSAAAKSNAGYTAYNADARFCEAKRQRNEVCPCICATHPPS